MFEKESEDYAARETSPRQELYVKGRADIDVDYEAVKRIWREGAEFGYNKANEWHYVKNGDLPKTENRIVLCICIGGYINNEPNYVYKLLTSREFCLFQPVVAWKEIVLPELKESE